MKVNFISEVSSNHNNNINRCFEFIQKSADAGCYGVKFQLFKINSLFAPEILKYSKRHRDRAGWELPIEFLPEISDCCKHNNIKFGCTPFYLSAVDELYPYVDFYKISSYELLWTDLFKKIAETAKPLIFSIGMAVENEVRNAIDMLQNFGAENISILHCNSSYPTPIKDVNLNVMDSLRNIAIANPNIKIGWSDHTVSPGVIYRAVHKFGAEIIEFHLDTDGTGKEYQFGHCWLPEQIKNVISEINIGMAADGNYVIEPSGSEQEERLWRADPSDGLRPLVNTRKLWIENQTK